MNNIKTTTPLQNAIMLSSIIGSIMSNYDHTIAADRKKPIDTIRRRIKKFMFRRARINKREFLEATAIANSVWASAVNHFAEKKMKIDAVSTVVGLYSLYEEPLSKFATIHHKQMESYSYNPNTPVDIERQSNEVSDYILEKLSAFTGVQKRKLNLLKKVKDENKINQSRCSD